MLFGWLCAKRLRAGFMRMACNGKESGYWPFSTWCPAVGSDDEGIARESNASELVVGDDNGSVGAGERGERVVDKYLLENAKDEAVVGKPDDASEPCERGRSLERLARERCGRGVRLRLCGGAPKSKRGANLKGKDGVWKKSVEVRKNAREG